MRLLVKSLKQSVHIAVWFVATLLTASVVFSSGSHSDPLDSFVIMEVTSDGQTARHAAVYRYSHANSSNNLIAIWIKRGSAPTAAERPSGDPLFASDQPQTIVRLRWPDQSGKLIVELMTADEIPTSSNFNDCYFNYGETKNLVCIDPDRVELRKHRVQ